MKGIKLIFILLVVVSMASCKTAKQVYLFSYFTGNGQDGLHLAYSEDGYNWTTLKNNHSFLTPTVGQDKLMRDPCVIKGKDGKFHMVWTVSWKERGIGYASSNDLVNWSEQKYIPVMEHEPTARNCWAPELFYDKDSDLYMIYWATTIPGLFPETQVEGDNGLNHRIYYVTTKDFITFSETKLLYDQGFNAIDAVIKKIDGKYVMFVKDETIQPEPRKDIRISISDKLTEGYSPAGEPITKSWVEGPTIAKIGDTYVLYFDKYRQKKMGAVVSTDLKTWTDVSEMINFPAGTRHGTFFVANQKILEKLLKQK
jgi:predicted GH43/DUF377 family glycosyl hydrolase